MSARRLAWASLELSAVALLLAGWELLARSGAVTPFMLPPLSAVLGRMAHDLASGRLLLDAALTLYRALLGFAIAGLLGTAIGIAMGRSRRAHFILDPFVSLFYPMPKIAFLPVIILWLGFFDVSKVAMVTLDAIFPVIGAAFVAVQGVEKELVWSARACGAGKREILWQTVLPASLPQIMTGLQVALPIALVVEAVCEMMMGGAGIGGAMMMAARFADSRGTFAGLVELALLGFVMVRLMASLRRRLLHWHGEVLEN